MSHISLFMLTVRVTLANDQDTDNSSYLFHNQHEPAASALALVTYLIDICENKHLPLITNLFH